MLKITPEIVIDDAEIEEQFVRASGPGGQNVNKVSTAVQLRFNVFATPNLSWAVRERLIKLAGKRINSAGELQITSQRFRTQAQNRVDARERLADLIRKSLHAPKPRRPTKPSAGARKRRLESKQLQGKLKRTRAKNLSSVE